MDREKKITTIYKDLSKIDTTFKNDKSLKAVVTSFVVSKPEVHFDENFSKTLRSQLTNAPHLVDVPCELDRQPVKSGFAVVSSYISEWISMSGRIASGVAGAALALLIAVPMTYIATRHAGDLNLNVPTSVKDITSGITLKQQISDKGTNAFGKLALLPSDTQSVASSSSLSTTAAPTNSEAAPLALSGTASSNVSSVSQTAPIVFSYTYTGDSIKVDNDSGTVFKRDKGTDAGNQLASFIQGSNFGLVNLSTFSNLDLKTMQLAEKEDQGYTVGINFDESTVNISSNSDSNQTSVASSSLPDDATLISKTTNFLTSHAIDMSSYAQPYVLHTSDTTNPNQIIVLYPLILRGQDVFDESGNRYGLEVVVDGNAGKIIAVNNLASQVYESSVYTLETDPNHILAKIPKTIPAIAPANAKIVPINLGTSRKVLMRTVVTDADGVTNELYVPALLFAPTSSTEGAPNIVIPLLKDTLGKNATSSNVTNSAATENALSSTSPTV